MAQTDNSFLADKVMLRVNNLPETDPVRVLDCYGGFGLVWAWVRALTGRDIRVLGIDVREVGFALPGDNRAYLSTIDLSKFDVIDLDAYGIPFEQLEAILDRGFHGRIFVTFIQSVFGSLPHKMLYRLGYTKNMIDKIPTAFYKHGWEKIKLYLAMRGLKTVVSRSSKDKHYFYINCAEALASGLDNQTGGTVAGLA